MNKKILKYLKTNFVVACFLTACGTKSSQSTSEKEKATPISTGTKVELNADNLADYLSFESDTASNDSASIKKSDFLDVNVGFEINVKYFYRSEYTNYDPQVSGVHYSYKLVSFKSEKKDENTFYVDKEFTYIAETIENTFNITPYICTSNCYKIEYDFKNVDGYCIFNNKCFGVYAIDLNMDNYLHFFRIGVEKTEGPENGPKILCYSIWPSSYDDPYHAYFFTELNIELEYASFNIDYTIKNSANHAISFSFLSSSSATDNKIFFESDDEDCWDAKIKSVSGTCYVKGTSIYD